jgi:hypothetical protein
MYIILAERHKQLGLSASTGDVPDMCFDEMKGELVISKSLSIDELSERLSGYIKPGTVSLTDVDVYYQTNRTGAKY